MEEYRDVVFKTAHIITGEYLRDGKIDQYNTDEGEYRIHFSDNGYWLVVEISVVED